MPARKNPQPGLGRAVRQLRQERGITQERVARQAGLHLTWINRMENGRTNPTWGSMKRVAWALKVSLGELATLAEEKDREKSRAPRRDGSPGS
ncbi:MAG TPA: helix-turn-helix transcriptional regulator [Solirubrobacterales bacterium]|jgi:transcriptional regulator with XRE-family HTH domain|nr:helix-turn-helix transcriptional regulator [Solirubrobacterales bacterium]